MFQIVFPFSQSASLLMLCEKFCSTTFAIKKTGLMIMINWDVFEIDPAY